MLRKFEEHLYLYKFGRDRPMALIDGYDGTVHREPFQKCHGRWILDGVPG